jgi:hypothetical protein
MRKNRCFWVVVTFIALSGFDFKAEAMWRHFFRAPHQDQTIASMLQAKEIIGNDLLQSYLHSDNPHMVLHFVCSNPEWLEKEPQLLMYFISSGALREAKALVSSLPPQCDETLLQTALTLSVIHADEALDHLLLSRLPARSLNPRLSTHGMNLLMVSLWKNKKKTASFLFQHALREHLLSKDRFHNTALHFAAQKGFHYLTLQMAEAFGPSAILETNVLGHNSIHCALAGGHFFLARHLAQRAQMPLKGTCLKSLRTEILERGGGLALQHEPLVRMILSMTLSVHEELKEPIGEAQGIPAFHPSENGSKMLRLEDVHRTDVENSLVENP